MPRQPPRPAAPPGGFMGLFGKEQPDAKPAPAPAPPRPAPAPAGPSAARAAGSACVIGAKTTVKGEVTGDEDVLVEGAIEGRCASRATSVSPLPGPCARRSRPRA